MPSRTLPNLGLTGFWDLGEDGWKPGMDINLQTLSALVQLSVISGSISTPPGAPVDGDSYIVGPAPTGAWTGHATKIAAWLSSAWVIFTPRAGWVSWVNATSALSVFNGTVWVSVGGGGGGPTFPDNTFGITDNLDATKIAQFQVSGLPTATTRTYTLPNIDGEFVLLQGAQTVVGDKTFSGAFVASAASVSLGTALGDSTANIGIGATTNGNTKTVNLGTGGVSGSITGINIGSTVAGALGTLVINSPTVTFASTVSAIAMAAANLSVLRTGIGGATADATNRLSINSPGALFNHAGGSSALTVNKNAAADDARFTFQTGFSTRALFGTMGSDDFRLSVSPDGAAFFDAFTIARATGLMNVANGLTVVGALTLPAGSVTRSMQSSVATASIMGRTTAGTGVQEVLTAAQATALLDVATAAAKGLGPVRSGVATEFLNGDGAYSTPAGVAAISEVELDFGVTPVRSRKFVVVHAPATATSKIIMNQSGAAPTGRQADENEMDAIYCSCNPDVGQFTVFATCLTGSLTGLYKFNFMMGN